MAVYLVSQKDAPEGVKPRMIEARTAPSAIAFAARSTFGAQTLTTKEALSWASEGIELEDANAEKTEAAD